MGSNGSSCGRQSPALRIRSVPFCGVVAHALCRPKTWVLVTLVPSCCYPYFSRKKNKAVRNLHLHRREVVCRGLDPAPMVLHDITVGLLPCRKARLPGHACIVLLVFAVEPRRDSDAVWLWDEPCCDD